LARVKSIPVEFIVEQLDTLASFKDVAPDQDEFLQEVLEGLSRQPKALPSKYFYDEHGSDLFNQICLLPEYYPTRTETNLLRNIAGEVAAVVGPDSFLIEYGAGSSEKMRIVLDALEAPGAFVAVDISREHLLVATKALAADRPNLTVHAVCADYSKPFKLRVTEAARVGRKVAFFPGSSLGNFTPQAAREFLATAAGVVGHGGGMLIGIDMKKDESILLPAYNDSQGVTAAFNLNLLKRINAELGGTFDLTQFRHKAIYNAEEGRIEMHLESLKDQTVYVDGVIVEFCQGETIHTENSYKYSISEFQNLALCSGFSPVKVWTDSDDLFSIHFLEVGN
jgi:dimethylhistidine N-methyltransferase